MPFVLLPFLTALIVIGMLIVFGVARTIFYLTYTLVVLVSAFLGLAAFIYLFWIFFFAGSPYQLHF